MREREGAEEGEREGGGEKRRKEGRRGEGSGREDRAGEENYFLLQRLRKSP